MPLAMKNWLLQIRPRASWLPGNLNSGCLSPSPTQMKKLPSTEPDQWFISGCLVGTCSQVAAAVLDFSQSLIASSFLLHVIFSIFLMMASFLLKPGLRLFLFLTFHYVCLTESKLLHSFAFECLAQACPLKSGMAHGHFNWYIFESILF